MRGKGLSGMVNKQRFLDGYRVFGAGVDAAIRLGS